MKKHRLMIAVLALSCGALFAHADEVDDVNVKDAEIKLPGTSISVGDTNVEGLKVGRDGVSFDKATTSGNRLSVGGIGLNVGEISTPGMVIDHSGVTTGGTYQSSRAPMPPLRALKQNDGRLFQGGSMAGADLSYHSLVGARFQGTMFSGALFIGSDLSAARFQGGLFDGADFSDATFKETRFQGGDFTGASFRNACLVGAKLQGGFFEGADFSGAVLTNADVQGVDLSTANTNGVIWAGPTDCASGVAAAPSVRPEVMSAADISSALAHGENSYVDLTVNFHVDSDRVEDQARVQVMEIAQALTSPQLTDAQVLIQGHTDSTGEDAYNLDLSYRRALSVRMELVSLHGIDPQRLLVTGYGETQPIMPNTTDEGMSMNRRVTLVNVGIQGSNATSEQ